MITPRRGALYATYEYFATAISAVPGGAWLIGWLDPLHISRRLLRQVVQERAHYAHGSLLDLGCGIQPYRDLFSHVDRYIGIDVPNTPGAHVQGDGQVLPFQAASFDTVLCNEVLEHVPQPARLMIEVTRVLKPGGILMLTTPQTWGLHHEPYDYYRYTKYGLRYLAEQAELEVIEIVPTSGMWATLAQRLADTVANTYAVDSSPLVHFLVMLSMAPVLMTGYALDQIFGKRGDTLDNVLVARKLI